MIQDTKYEEINSILIAMNTLVAFNWDIDWSHNETIHVRHCEKNIELHFSTLNEFKEWLKREVYKSRIRF